MTEERRKNITLTDEQMEAIAEKAAHKALEVVYAEVGKAVLKKVAWIVGVVVISVMMWLSYNGKLHT